MTHFESPPLEMFRANPARDGQYPARGAPRFNGVKWKVQTRQWVISSPAVVTGPNGLVCFGGWDGKLYAVDIETGERRWTFPTVGGIVSSPAVDGGLVIFGSYDNHVYAADVTKGLEVWRFRTANSVASSPLVTRQFIPAGVVSSFPVVKTLCVAICGIDGCVYFLDAFGHEMGRFEAGFPIVSSPAGPVAASPASLMPDSPDPAIVAVGGRDGYLYAIEMKTAGLKWRFQTGGPIESSAAVAHGAFYFGSCDGCLYAVDAANGVQRWRFKTDGPVLSSPAVADDTVYFGGQDAFLYAVSARTGAEQWKFKTGGPIESSPAVASGVVYVGSDDANVYAVDAIGGEELWRFETGGEVRSSPTVADGAIYVGSNDGRLYALQ